LTKQLTTQTIAEDRGVCGSVIKDNVGGFFLDVMVTLNEGEEIVGLSAWSCPKLVVGECVVGFGVDVKSGDKNTLEELGKGAVKVNASEGGRAEPIPFSAFEDGLNETFLPGLRLTIREPHSAEHQEKGLSKVGTSGSNQAVG